MSAAFYPAACWARPSTTPLAQWPALLVFLGDGRLEIDSNLVENAIRPTAVGKKNRLFIGAAAAGDRSAIIYTVIESCRRRGLDPFAYLREVFMQLPSMTNSQVKDLTPKTWQRGRGALVYARLLSVIAHRTMTFVFLESEQPPSGVKRRHCGRLPFFCPR